MTGSQAVQLLGAVDSAHATVHLGKDRLRQAVTLAASLTLLSFGGLGLLMFGGYRFMTGQLPAITRMQDLQSQILLFDEVLTMSALMSAATGDPQWEARHRRFEPQLDQAIKEARRLIAELASSQLTAQTNAANIRLVAMEDRVFELVRQGQQAGAQEVLSSDEYEFQKRAYSAGVAEVNRILKQSVDSESAQGRAALFWTIAAEAVMAPMLTIAWWFVARTARRQRGALQGYNQELTVTLRDLKAFKAALDEHAIVAITDGRGRITYVNDKFCAISKYAREELLGQDHRIVNSGHHAKAFMSDLWRTIAGGRVWKGEIKNRAKDGTFYWVDTTIVPFLDEQGKPVQFIAIRADITSRKEREEEVRQLNAALQEHTVQLLAANKELEAFSYTVSHDLRAPLRHIQGFAELLQRLADNQLSEKGLRYLKTIEEASTEMGHLIDALLAFSRMSRSEMSESLVDIGTMTQATIRSLESVRGGRDIAWHVSPLPVVVGDPALLRQVLANLLGNAVKYTGQRDSARIEIGTTGEENGRVVIFVRDNGAGFDMQYAHKLFGVFQRLHRAEEFEGVGIGLATVQRIVVRHGGRVWAEGAPGEGATFYFTLKAAVPEREPSPTGSTPCP